MKVQGSCSLRPAGAGRGRGRVQGRDHQGGCEEEDRKTESQAVPGVMLWAEGEGALAEFSTTFS